MLTILKCTITKGMFSNERVAEIETARGGVVSYFVPSEFVDDERSGIEVAITPGGDKGSARVVIPTQSRPTIFVKESDLVSVP